MKKLLILLGCLLVLLAFDFALSKTALPINHEGYLRGFNNFYQKAKATKGQKRIILMGGSSLSWGVSAEKLSQELDVLVLNAGIKASIGYRNFIRTIEDVVDKENDILVISPEYSLVTKRSLFERSASFCEIEVLLKGRYLFECIGYTLAKIARVIPIIDRKADDYFASGFNQYGDYTFRREGVNMVGKLRSDGPCFSFHYEELTDQYIPYIKSLQTQGYELVYVANFYPKVNCMNNQDIEHFHESMFAEFGIPDYLNVPLLYDERFFYNTSYHLTAEGVKMKTRLFSEQLQHYLVSR